MIWLDVDTVVTMIVNKVPLVDSATGAIIDEGILFNESGMDLNWNFITTAGVASQVNVVPTSAGDDDWDHNGNGIYTMGMKDADGVTVANDTAGFGWWSGIADDILPFTSPVYGFRAAAINAVSVDGATAPSVLTAADNIGINWGDVSNPTTTLNLSGTTIKTATDVEADTDELQGDDIPGRLSTIDAYVDCLPATLHNFDPSGDDVAMVTALHANYDPTKVKFANGKVYVATGGASNETYPAGEASAPTDTLARGISIAGTNNVDTLDVHGDHTTTGDMEGYVFLGHGHLRIAERININSHSVEHSSFKSLVVQGTMANATGVLTVARFDDCKLWALSDIHGISTDGVLLGACSILSGGIGIFNDPGCGALAACTLTLNDPVTCVISNMRGVLTLAGMTGGTCFVSLAPGATLIIASSCSAGAITVSGEGTLTDGHTGTCTVTDARNRVLTNAEVVDCLTTDTYAQRGQAAIPATASIEAKISDLHKMMRNKKDNDGTTRQLYNDDSSTVDQKSGVGEAAGTVTTDEWEAGP